MASAPASPRPPAPVQPALTPPAAGRPVAVELVEQTSLAARSFAPDEVTVRFSKWTAHANTAYQKGQFAGFRRDVAQRLIASGVATVAETAAQHRDAADRFMLTK